MLTFVQITGTARKTDIIQTKRTTLLILDKIFFWVRVRDRKKAYTMFHEHPTCSFPECRESGSGKGRR